MHEAGDVLGAPAPAVERGAPVRKTSTTFHEPPDYRGADLDLEGGQGATRQTRTFSRREASRIDSAHFCECGLARCGWRSTDTRAHSRRRRGR
jgi:hypothetical protein